MVNYGAIATQFADSGYTPSEVHGMITAFCCAAGSLHDLKQVFAEEGDADLANEVHRLYQVINTELADEDLVFQPLLSDSEDNVQQQTKGLSEWCQGFTTGAEMNHLNKKANLSEECVEALAFFKEVIQIEEMPAETTEEDEKDFVELQEYVRMSVLMIYTELRIEQEEAISDKTH